MDMEKINLKQDTNYIYTLFVWTASNCSPNRDGGTGEIRVDPLSRVFITQECFNQNVKNGIFYSRQSGLLNTNQGVELLGCKNEFFGPRTLKMAQKELLVTIAHQVGKNDNDVQAEDVFKYCFDIPLFGEVNSNGLRDPNDKAAKESDKKPHPAFPASITGSTGLIYLPKTVTQVKIDNRGISNSFSQPKSKDNDEPKGMPGSHFTDYLEEGVFICLGQFNVKQLKFIASQKLGISDEKMIHDRIEQLYNLYLTGIWEGYKLLGYASTMRKGQQPFALYSIQKEHMPGEYISDPAYLLADEDGTLPMHVSFQQTINVLDPKLDAWKKRFESKKGGQKDTWEKIVRMSL